MSALVAWPLVSSTDAMFALSIRYNAVVKLCDLGDQQEGALGDDDQVSVSSFTSFAQVPSPDPTPCPTLTQPLWQPHPQPPVILVPLREGHAIVCGLLSGGTLALRVLS